MKTSQIKLVLVLVGFILALIGMSYGHFKVWRLKHPDAPTWTYFL